MSINTSDTSHKRPGYIHKSVSFLSKVYIPQVPKIKEAIQNKEYGNAMTRGAQFAIQAPYSIEMAKDTYNAVKDPSSLKFYKAMQYNSSGTSVAKWTFFPESFKAKLLQNKYLKSLVPAIDKLDITVNDTFIGKKILTTIDKNAKYISKGSTGIVEGSKKAVNAGNIMGKIPLFGTLFASILEMPNIIKAAKRGDGINQAGRSAINIVGGTVACAALGSLCACIVPPIGGFIGSTIGAIIGGKISQSVGNKVFGPPIKDVPKFEYAQPIYYQRNNMS